MSLHPLHLHLQERHPLAFPHPHQAAVYLQPHRHPDCPRKRHLDAMACLQIFVVVPGSRRSLIQRKTIVVEPQCLGRSLGQGRPLPEVLLLLVRMLV